MSIGLLVIFGYIVWIIIEQKIKLDGVNYRVEQLERVYYEEHDGK